MPGTQVAFGLDGLALAIVMSDGLGSDMAGLTAELDAKSVKALTLGREPGSLDPSDESGLLARIAEALRAAPAAEAPEPGTRAV